MTKHHAPTQDVMTTPLSNTLSLSSGYTISVQPLPPYYTDFIEDEFPFEEYPRRTIKLAAGDTLDIDYDPPQTPPDTSNDEEYALYMRWFSTKSNNEKIQKERERVRRDFLLSTCVTVVDGPDAFEDDSWVHKLEAAFNDYIVPVHPGKRMLAFLKSHVIRSAVEYSQIVNASVFREITMQGVEDSLRGFQNEMERRTTRQRHNGKAKVK